MKTFGEPAVDGRAGKQPCPVQVSPNLVTAGIDGLHE